MHARNRAALLTAIVMLLSVTVAQAAEKIKWQTNFAAAKAAAKKSHKLIFADFYAEW
jgi:hypothetical protein